MSVPAPPSPDPDTAGDDELADRGPGRGGRNPRTCIVTRQAQPEAELIRFVAGPDGIVVPDLRRRLPGRGAWVGARADLVATAVRKGLFARALKTQIQAGADLPETVGRLLQEAALASLSLARKAGLVVTGSGQVEGALRDGRGALLLHAAEAAADGRRKVLQAAHAGGLDALPVEAGLTGDQLDQALGGGNVMHALALPGGATTALLERLRRWRDYRADGSGTGGPKAPRSGDRDTPT